MIDAERIFCMSSFSDSMAMEMFRFQFSANALFRRYCTLIGKTPERVHKINDLPFLPISFFKSHKVSSCANESPALIFKSSGTTDTVSRSQHLVYDVSLYRNSLIKCFDQFFSADLRLFALLPSYLEKGESSLVYMCKTLMECENIGKGGFYLYEHQALVKEMKQAIGQGEKLMLIGTTHALLDLAEEGHDLKLDGHWVVETGGMKGRRKERVREEIHAMLKRAFQCSHIASEYGMTELFSQGWALQDGRFQSPPWMKVVARDPYDPFSLLPTGSQGALNVIDLANRDSCAFIATDDLGIVNPDGSFEVLGRLDASELRGCSLMTV